MIGSNSQIVHLYSRNRMFSVSLPQENHHVITGVKRGSFEDWFTPAFWRVQFELQVREGRYAAHALGRNLNEEIAACLLGGYGIPAELGLLAFRRLRDRNLLDGAASSDAMEAALSEPFSIAERERRYRFPRQKAAYLSNALMNVAKAVVPRDALKLRQILLELPGIGPKTASWIVRNYCNSSNVAIIDIHILRAGQLMGLFDPADDPAKKYFELETRFLAFCSALGAPACALDALIWDYMRRIGPTAFRRPNRSARRIPHAYKAELTL